MAAVGEIVGTGPSLPVLQIGESQGMECHQAERRARSRLIEGSWRRPLGWWCV